MNEYIAVMIAVSSSIQSLALVWVIIKMIGVTDKALARAQAPEAVGSTPPPPASGTGKVVVQQSPTVPQPLPSPAPSGPVDEAYIAWLKKEEGFKTHAYPDFKQFSIGYGTKASGPNETITEPEADKRLREEVAIADHYVETFVPPNTPKGVKQALVDLTYNAGPGWQKAGLGELVKAANWEAAKSRILQYNHADGEVNVGLTARREAEVKWFDNPL